MVPHKNSSRRIRNPHKKMSKQILDLVFFFRFLLFFRRHANQNTSPVAQLVSAWYLYDSNSALKSFIMKSNAEVASSSLAWRIYNL